MATIPFQSSPADEGRCCLNTFSSAFSTTRFNPHRPMKAGAAWIIVRLGVRHLVSILTGR